MRLLLFSSNYWNFQLLVIIWWIVLATCFDGTKAGEIHYTRMTVFEDEIQTFSLWTAVLHCAIENPKYTSSGRCSSIQWTLDYVSGENGSSNQPTASHDFQETKTVNVAIDENSDVFRIITSPETNASHLQILRDEEFIKGRYSCTVFCGPDSYTTTCMVTIFLHQNRSFLCAERMFPQSSRLPSTPSGDSTIIDLSHLQTHSERKADPKPSLTRTRDTPLAISPTQAVLAWSHGGGLSDARPVSRTDDKDEDEADEEDSKKVSVAISFFGGCVVIVLLVSLTRWCVKRRMSLKQLAVGSVRWQVMDARSAEDHSDDDSGRPGGSSDEETWEARPRRYCRGRPCLTRGAAAGQLTSGTFPPTLTAETGLPRVSQTAYHQGSDRRYFSFPLLQVQPRGSVQGRPGTARIRQPSHRGSSCRDVYGMLGGSSPLFRPEARDVLGDVEIAPLVADPSLEMLHLPSYDESEAEALQGKSGNFSAAAESGRAALEGDPAVVTSRHPENDHGAQSHPLHPRTIAANLITIQVTYGDEDRESFTALPSEFCRSSKTPGVGLFLLAPAADLNLPPPPYHSATAVRGDERAKAVKNNIDAEQHSNALSRPPSYRTALESQDGTLHWHRGRGDCAVPVAIDDNEDDNNNENHEFPCDDNDDGVYGEEYVRR